MNNSPNVPFIANYTNFQFADLVDENNVFHKNVNISDARNQAKNVGLNLVCFKNPEGQQLALCKILDFNKWKYNIEKQRRKEQQKNRKSVKEMEFTPDIGEHDIAHKVRKVEEFLEDGDEVIISMFLKGRQKLYFAEAEQKMNGIVGLCDGKEVHRKKTGSSIIVHLTKNKKEGGENEKDSNDSK